jgi:hypothetical protein
LPCDTIKAEKENDKEWCEMSMDGNGVVRFGGLDWLVKDVSADKSRALLVAKELLGEDRQYHRIHYLPFNWETSDIRKWLGGAFFGAFSAEERGRIVPTVITNGGNAWFGTEGCCDTEDTVFLLSIEEAAKYFGGGGLSALRRTGADGGEDANGGFAGDEHNGLRAAERVWWLRTPGRRRNNAANVAKDGRIFVAGSSVPIPLGIRPAMWITL